MTQQKYTTLTGLGLLGFVLLGAGAWAFSIYNRTPTISMASDNLSSTVGDHVFIVTGSNFIPFMPPKVLVGGNPATDIQVSSSKTLLARAPKGNEGAVDITIINPSGKQAVLVGGYTYSHLKPVITSVTPNVLNPAGGEIVTVKGSGFAASPVVVHFHTSVVAARVFDDNTLTFVNPPAANPRPSNINLEVSTQDDAWSSDEFGLNYQ